MIRYLRIYWKLIKFSAIMEMTYRFSFLLEIFVETVYITATILSIRVFYWNIDNIAGWDLNEILVLFGINAVFSEILLGMTMIHNLRNLPHKITSGELDLALLKPINSQFTVSLWRPYFALVPSLIPGLSMILVGFIRGRLFFNPLFILPFLVIFVCGLVIAYSICMMITTLAFWLPNAHALPEIGEHTIFIAKVPYSAYTGIWRGIFLVAVPLVFMVNFPAQVLLGELVWWWIPLALLLATIFLLASSVFWKFALKSYSGASS